MVKATLKQIARNLTFLCVYGSKTLEVVPEISDLTKLKLKKYASKTIN
jgi:hypothetical protein